LFDVFFLVVLYGENLLKCKAFYWFCGELN